MRAKVTFTGGPLDGLAMRMEVPQRCIPEIRMAAGCDLEDMGRFVYGFSHETADEEPNDPAVRHYTFLHKADGEGEVG